MMTYRVGACATPSAGKAMAEYYLAGTLKTEQTRAAEYYTGAEAREERAADFWRGAIREGHLAAGGTVAELRPDLSPALAARLGIANPERPLTQAGIANLLNATRLDGSAIVGRKKHTATRSVAEVFGLDPKQPASAEAIRNVLAGKRADGGMPQTEAGKASAGGDRRGRAQAVQGGAGRAGASRGDRRRNPTPGEWPSGKWPADRYGGLPPPDPRHAPAGRFCRHDVFRRQIVVGRLGVGADRSGTGCPIGYSPPCRCRRDGLCRDTSRRCSPGPGRRGGGRDRRTRVDQLPALHRAAGRRYRAAGQSKVGPTRTSARCHCRRRTRSFTPM